MESHLPSTGHVSRGPLWFGFTGAAAAWILQGLTSVFITLQACEDGSADWGPLSQTSVRWLLIGWTAAMLIVAVAAGITAFRIWRRLSEQRRLSDAEGRQREEFMALVGLFSSVAFTLGIVWASIPTFFVDICMGAK